MYPNSVPAILSKNVGNTLTTYRTWKGVIYNVKDYGAEGNGVKDDTSAIQAAITACPEGGWVFLPAGTYLINGTITINKGIKFSGANWSTIIKTLHATANMIDVVNAFYVCVEDLFLTSAVTRTGGYGINHPSGAYFTARNLYLGFQYIGINSAGVLDYIENVVVRDFKHTGIYISGGGDQTLHRVVTDNEVTPTGSGIEVRVTAALFMSDCDIIRSNICLHFTPDVPGAYSFYAVNCFFDTSNYGVVYDGTSYASRHKYTNCWFSSHKNVGVKLNNAMAMGIDFVNCDFYDNATDGIYVAFAANWSVSHSRFAGNKGSGISLSSTSGKFEISHNVIGATADFPNNGFGIFLNSGAYDTVVIRDNMFTTNTNTHISDASTSSAIKNISGNIGVNPVVNNPWGDSTTLTRSGASAYSGATQSISANTATKMIYPYKNFDRLTEYNNATYRFTSTKGGLYLATTNIVISPTASASYAQASIYINGAEIIRGDIQPTSTTVTTMLKIANQVYLNPGDYLEIYIFSPVALTTGSVYSNLFSCSQVA